MTASVAFVRGVNVGGNKMLSSAALKEACESLGLRDVKTYLNSGNVVFRGKTTASRIEKAIGIDARVILRTTDELRAAIEANPFSAEAKRDPGHLLITFLSGALSAQGKTMLTTHAGPEKVHIGPREAYIYFPEGQGRSKLSALLTEKKLGAVPTGRNWNTVNALLKMLDALSRS